MTQFSEDLQQIRQALKFGLPGHAAQQKLAPVNRNGITLDYLQQYPDFKIAGVLLLVYPKDEQSTVVFIERADFGHHAGQISLPGGKKDMDESIIQTALRETFEEIGVYVTEEKVWSPLTEIYIPPSNFLVHPFLAVLEEKPVFMVNHDEVKRTIEISLRDFLSDGALRELNFTTSKGNGINAPGYQVSGVEIWGATAMIISELICLLKYPSN